MTRNYDNIFDYIRLVLSIAFCLYCAWFIWDFFSGKTYDWIRDVFEWGHGTLIGLFLIPLLLFISNIANSLFFKKLWTHVRPIYQEKNPMLFRFCQLSYVLGILFLLFFYIFLYRLWRY